MSKTSGAIEAVEDTTHTVFFHEPNWIWAREMSCFPVSCFSTSFQPCTACKGMCIANLKKSNALERTESNGSHNIIPEINEDVAAVYDRKVHVEKVTQLDESQVYIIFYQHCGEFTNTAKFRIPKRDVQI